MLPSGMRSAYTYRALYDTYLYYAAFGYAVSAYTYRASYDTYKLCCLMLRILPQHRS